MSLVYIEGGTYLGSLQQTSWWRNMIGLDMPLQVFTTLHLWYGDALDKLWSLYILCLVARQPGSIKPSWHSRKSLTLASFRFWPKRKVWLTNWGCSRSRTPKHLWVRNLGAERSPRISHLQVFFWTCISMSVYLTVDINMIHMYIYKRWIICMYIYIYNIHIHLFLVIYPGHPAFYPTTPKPHRVYLVFLLDMSLRSWRRDPDG